MSWFYRRCLREALFAVDSEEIHNRTLQALGWISRHENLCDFLRAFHSAPALPMDVFGLHFPNPLGLAAGMDKHATAVPVWEALGFGFAELGGVTWQAQLGNPQPRMFRAIADAALINRMGFNNPGAQVMAETLRAWKRAGRWPLHPVGVNLGKSKLTPLAEAAEDYAQSFRLLRPLADFFVVNVSSPNTPHLRQLQDKAALDEILAALQELNEPGSLQDPGTKPILIKVAPDLSFDALDEILGLTASRRIAGIVATNTTVARPTTNDLTLQAIYHEAGGLSGGPLRQRSTEVIRHLWRQTRGALPIIGVGGIFTVEDAWEKILAGASLLQVYTGLVYEGPGIVRTIVSGLRERLAAEGARELREVIGREADGSA